MNNTVEKSASDSSTRNIIIKTQQGEVEVTGISHNQPGLCPHCHRAIPLSSVVFKKIGVNKNVVTFTGSELAAEHGISIDQQNEAETTYSQQSKPGECRYCHKQIPINGIIFRENK